MNPAFDIADLHMTDIAALKIFISSPSDVRPERLVAERVVRRLAREFAYHFQIEPVMWERAPLVASQHFQEGLTPPGETDIVVVILWSRLGVVLPLEKFSGPLSGKPVTGTEWEFENALEATRLRKLPDLLMYRKKGPIIGSLDDDEAVHQQLLQKHLVEDFMKRWFIDQDAQAFTAAFREFVTTAEFEDLVETHLRELLKKRLAGVQAGARGSAAEDQEILPTIRYEGNPFRGLESFELQHAQLFFGRTQARNELRELLVRQIERGSAFLLVVGASGSGKSSLVKAGLLADLKLQGMVGNVALVRHAIFRPSEENGDLLEALAAAILSPTALPELASLHCDRATLKEFLRAAPAQARVPIRQALTAAAQAAALTDIAEARLVIVLDQLEEMFTQHHVTDAERETFVAALAALAKSGSVWIIATMRSDFFDRLERLPGLLALTAGEARYVLGPAAWAEIEQIILLPAHEAGVRFEKDATRSLAKTIQEEATRSPDSLPLLSFVLDQLWRRRDKTGLLTFQAYAEIGGLAGALSQRAEEVFMAQEPHVRAALPFVLRRLVSVAEGTTSGGYARSTPLATFPQGTPAYTLVAALLKARLLVADRDLLAARTEGLDAASAADGDVTIVADKSGAQVRIAHEALLHHWPRARDQIAADRRDLELLGRLEHAGERWAAADRKNRDGLVLSRGLLLSEATDLLRRWTSELPAGVIAFIKRSQQVALRRRLQLVGALIGAVALVPATIFVAWAILVWRGVQQVEAQMAFVAIPQGCFTMGTPPGEVGRFDHETQHRVCIPPFGLGKFAVTQDEWRRVMVENADPARFKGGRRPVEMVSWEDARAFAWRMEFFGHYHYRLPSEAEWEYAARAGTVTPWFWGKKIEDGCAYANLRDEFYKSKHFDVDEAIIACSDGYDYTAPVGSFKPNPFGLYDMTGNVFQWTEDCFGSYAAAPADGHAKESEHCEERVVRGGSWTSRPRFTRTGSRDLYAPTNRNDVVGFRLAR